MYNLNVGWISYLCSCLSDFKLNIRCGDNLCLLKWMGIFL